MVTYSHILSYWRSLLYYWSRKLVSRTLLPRKDCFATSLTKIRSVLGPTLTYLFVVEPATSTLGAFRFFHTNHASTEFAFASVFRVTGFSDCIFRINNMNLRYHERSTEFINA